MTNGGTVLVLALVACAVFADAAWFDQQGLVALGQGLIMITTWLAFWR